MRIQNIVKALKKDSLILSIVILTLTIMFLSPFIFTNHSTNVEQASNEEISYPVMAPKTIEVKLERVYLDGEISEEIVQETIWSMEDFWGFYSEWFLVDQDENMIHFRQQVDDISPLLKINGYFGISPDGYLNLYDGRPMEENVIQSFFQINTSKLKSHQQFELKEGIPVMNTENYKEVLQTFKQYAVSEL